MIRIVAILLLVIPAVVFAGCNGDNGGGDAGVGDGDGLVDHDYDYDHDQENGDDGGSWVDVDLGEDLGLLVPEGTCVCGMTVVNAGDFAASFEGKGRVCFRAGMHRMQKDMRSFQLDLVESVEVGPEALAGVAAGPGVVTVTPPGVPDGEYSFMFEQEFEAGGVPFAVSIQLAYPSTIDVVTLDDAGLCDRLFYTSASWGGTALYLGSCRYSLFFCRTVKFDFEGGSWLKVENCNYCPKDWMCKANNGGMRRAELSDGQDVISQSDYFGLVHSWRHHNWGNDSLARFGQALGGIQAVYVGTNDYPDHFNYSQATFLDGDLNVVETRPVTGVQDLDQW